MALQYLAKTVFRYFRVSQKSQSLVVHFTLIILMAEPDDKKNNCSQVQTLNQSYHKTLMVYRFDDPNNLPLIVEKMQFSNAYTVSELCGQNSDKDKIRAMLSA